MRKRNNKESGKAVFSEDLIRSRSMFKRIISSDLFIILFVSAAFRIIYYFCLKPTYTYWDSQTYLLFNANIFNGEIDSWRTPLYPAFLKLIHLFGDRHYYISIVIAQGIISFASVIVFWLTAKLLFRSRAAIIASTILFGVMPAIIDFDLCVLTESLSISTMVFIFYFFVRFLKKPTAVKAILFTFVIFLAIMLRPSFLSLMAVLAVFWLARLFLFKEKRRISAVGFTTTIFCVLLLFGYSRLNYESTGCNTIAISSTMNQFDILVNSGIYEGGNDPEIIDTITNNLEDTQMPWNEKAKFAVLRNFPHDRVSKYIRSCILNNPKIYIAHALNKLLELSTKTTSVAYAIKKSGKPTKFVNFVNKFISIPFIVIYLLILIELVVLFIKWFFKKNQPWLRSVLLAIVAIQLITIVFGAQAEYQRIFSPNLPLVIILVFIYVDWLIFFKDNRRSQNATISKVSF